jgi:hypothetical protein
MRDWMNKQAQRDFYDGAGQEIPKKPFTHTSDFTLVNPEQYYLSCYA